MGDDLTVVNAARVSFDKESDWETKEIFKGLGPAYVFENGQTVLKPTDQKLISYLAKHNHWTPFSHAMITLRETVPIFVARQRFKHMVGFTYNEVSRRYVDDEPTFYMPKEWRLRAENKKQGSSDQTFKGDYYHSYADRVHELAYRCYTDMIKDGIAPEQARMVLPQSMYTSYYVTGSLAAFARAYLLRSDPHSQLEIQELASHWNNLIRPLFPVSWAALTAGSSSATTSADGATASSTTSNAAESSSPTTTSEKTLQLVLF
jgi:thymidylate synthase (FAD)